MDIKSFVYFALVTTLPLGAMSLDEVVQEALQNNNTLKKVSLNAERLKEEKNSKKSKKYGSFNFMASYDHYNNARTLTPLTPMDIVSSADGAYKIPATKDMLSTGVAYNVVLFDGFREQKSFEMADLAHEASVMKTELSKEEIAYNVRTLYLSALTLKHQLEAQQEYTAAQQKLYNMTQEGYKLGSKSKIDLLKAKNSLIQSHANEQKIASNLEIIKVTLSQLMGGKRLENLEDIEVVTTQNDTGDTAVESLQKYKALEFQNAIAQRKYETVESTYYPVVDMSAYYGFNMGPNATTNTHPVTNITYIDKNEFNSENIWQVGIHLKWNIYDFGVKSAQVQAQKISLEESRIDMNELKLEVEKNLKIAKNRFDEARVEYESALSQYELLREIVKVEELKYQTNALTLGELLDSRAKMRLAQGKMLQAKYEIQKAKYYRDYLLEQGVQK